MYNFYNSSLFVSSGDANSNQNISGSIQNLSRVQSVSIGIERPNTNYKFLNSQGKTFKTEPPFVNLAFSYFPTNGNNENLLNFSLDGTGNAIRTINQDKNFYILNLEGALEAGLYTGSDFSKYNVISIGNALLRSYNLSAQVGEIIISNLEYQGINILSQTGRPIGQQLPSVNLDTFYPTSGTYSLPTGYISYSDNIIKALTAADMVLTIPTGLAFGVISSGSNSISVQNFNFDFSINRNNIKEIGKNIKDRIIVFPIEFNVGFAAVLEKYQVDNFNLLSCNNTDIDINLKLRDFCSSNNILEFDFKKIKIESQTIVQSIGEKSLIELNCKGYYYNMETGCSYFSIRRY